LGPVEEQTVGHRLVNRREEVDQTLCRLKVVDYKRWSALGVKGNRSQNDVREKLASCTDACQGTGEGQEEGGDRKKFD